MRPVSHGKYSDSQTDFRFGLFTSHLPRNLCGNLLEAFHNAGKPPRLYLRICVSGSCETVERYSGSAYPFEVFFGSFCCTPHFASVTGTAKASTLPTKKIAERNLLLSTRDGPSMENAQMHGSESCFGRG